MVHFYPTMELLSKGMETFLAKNKVINSLVSMSYAQAEDGVVHFFRLPNANMNYLKDMVDILCVDIEQVERFNREAETNLMLKACKKEK